MVETLPQLTYGKVTGRFLAAVADSIADDNLFPDDVPLVGTVTFKPSAGAILLPNATPDPAIVLPTTIVAQLDAAGYLSLNGIRGIYLLATDTTNPVDWTWNVSFSLRVGTSSPAQYPSFDMSLPAGTIKDLVAVAPFPSSGGQPIIRDETVAIEAEQGALQAAADAQYWAGVAQEAAAGGGGSGGYTMEQINQALVVPHINNTTPHPAYDDMPSLVGYFENGLA